MSTMHPLVRLFADNAAAPRRFEIINRTEAEAEVLVYDVIGGFGIDAGQFARDLKALKASVIHLRINSPGGEVSAAKAMQTALAQHPARVIAHIDGLAASSATVVMLAADEIVASEGAFVMLHNPWSLTIGDSDAHRKSAEVLDKFTDSLVVDYQRKTGKDEKTVRAWMDAETWFSATEALDAGLVDVVEQVAAVKNEWQLGAFQNAPAALSVGNSEPEKQTHGGLQMQATGTGAAAGATPQTDQGQAAEVRRIALQHNLGAEFAERHVAAGTPLDTFRAAVLNELAAASDAHNIRGATSAATIVRDETETMREGMVGAMFARCRGKAPSELARPYAGLSAVQLAAETLNRRGVSTRGMSESRIIEAALHTTSDFPNILSGFAGKALLEAYQAAPGALKQVAREASAPDFKTRYVLRRGEFPSLQEVPEGAEYHYGTMGESSASYRLKTYGRIFGVSRRALIDDDLGAFSDVAAMVGMAAADFEASLLVSILVSNGGAGPVMPDGATLFDDAAHGNVGAGVIGVTGVDAGRAKMRRQKGVDGSQNIDAQPRFLVAPVSKQAAAEALVTAITPSSVSEVNPFAGQLIALADPRLDDASAAAWYLFADPGIVPAFEYAYLAGAPGPQIEQQVGFEVDGVKIKCRLDFGAAAIDWRGCYRSTGV